MSPFFAYLPPHALEGDPESLALLSLSLLPRLGTALPWPLSAKAHPCHQCTLLASSAQEAAAAGCLERTLPGKLDIYLHAKSLAMRITAGDAKRGCLRLGIAHQTCSVIVTGLREIQTCLPGSSR